MNTKFPGSAAVIALGVGVLSCPVSWAQQRGGEGQPIAGEATPAADRQQTAAHSVEDLTRGWPKPSRKAAKDMEQKYGAPAGVTPSQLIWENKGPWKEIVLSKEEVPHDFPKPHTDVLLQSIDYKVPPDKFDELAEYDGSIIVERTKGTMAARCDKEEMNFLALNLAHEIITGNKTVQQARDAYAETMKQVMAGQKPDYTKQLAFQPQQQAGDKDVAVLPQQPGEARPAAERQPPPQP